MQLPLLLLLLSSRKFLSPSLLLSFHQTTNNTITVFDLEVCSLCSSRLHLARSHVQPNKHQASSFFISPTRKRNATMKSHVLLTLSAASGLTKALAAPYIERSYRELTGNKTITTTASAKYHVDGLPGLPKPVISTSVDAQSTEAVEDAPIPIVTPGFEGSRIAPIPIVTPGFLGSRIAPESVHGLTTITVTATPPFDTDSPEPTSTTAAYGGKDIMMEQAPRIPAAHDARGLEVKQAGPAPAQQYTTLTFTFNTMTTTYTLALPNGADASETPAPVIRSSRSFPLAVPSGTWTEMNTMFTSTVPADVLRRSAPSSPVSAVETSTPVKVLTVTPTSVDVHYYRINPLPAPNPNPMEEALLSVTTPAPTMTMPKPKQEVRTTILNGGEGAVERVQGKPFSMSFSSYTPDHEGVYAGKHNDANRNDRNDEPESHDLSWYFTASYTDDSVSLTMDPCAYDWQCWPEPTSSNTEVFLPGVDGGKVAEATYALPVETEVATIRA